MFRAGEGGSFVDCWRCGKVHGEARADMCANRDGNCTCTHFFVLGECLLYSH